MNIKKAALVACSDALHPMEKDTVEKLKGVLRTFGIDTVESPYLYAPEDFALWSGKQRGEVLNACYRDDSIDAVFDLSGGDLANCVLPYLDYDAIAKSEKQFWGYSDLSCVINAIYAKTGRSSVLFQMKNLVWDDGERQTRRFGQYLQGGSQLFDANWKVLQGTGTVESLLAEAPVAGGNVRCSLKLAGTPYFPDVAGKVLFLESLAGGEIRIAAYFASLYQMGVFERVRGVLLGTFTQFQEENAEDKLFQMLREYIPADLLVAKTEEVGHAASASALRIG